MIQNKQNQSTKMCIKNKYKVTWATKILSKVTYNKNDKIKKILKRIIW